MREPRQWSTSGAFPRPGTISAAVARYATARETALAAECDSEAVLDAWCGVIDRVIATRAVSAIELANKARIMLVEGRGGAGCLTAILDDLDAMLAMHMPGSVAPAGDFPALEAIAEKQGLSPGMLEAIAVQLTEPAAHVRDRASKAVGNA